jgi:dipeptide/tripeptide permease
MGAQAGGWFTAWMTPLIARHFGWTASFLVAAALCLLGAVAWLFVDPQRKLEFSPKTPGPRLIPAGIPLSHVSK